MKISDLIKDLETCEVVCEGTESICGYIAKETEITMLHHDSRHVVPGSMFFCLEGTKVDGQKFAREAVSKGAVCIVTEKSQNLPKIVQIIVPDVRLAMSLIAKAFYGSHVDEMRVVGVVGTNGKTTCTHIMRHIFACAGEKVGVIGTLGTWFGERQIEGGLTTPDPIDLHRTFAEMYSDGIRTVIMESSAHAIYFKKLAGINFTSVIFTNISQDHLDFFETFENYAATKVNFFLQDNNIKTAIINTDDEFGKKIIKERAGESLGYSLDSVQLFSDKSIINNEFEVNLPARFNAYNALACITCSRVLGIADEFIKQALRTIPQISGRFNIVKAGDVSVIIDFAHTPDGLEKIISSVREFALKRIITVFGCGGNRDKKKRPIMGKISALSSDFTVITSDNPRFEKPLSIMKQIRKGFKAAKCKKYVMIEDRAEAIEFALLTAEPGDIVIIAGKGGETHTEINGKFIEYTDESVIAHNLNVIYPHNAVITTHIKKGV